MRRRYEVWFLRFVLADGSGAWWLRYLLLNLRRGGCAGRPDGMPAQVWATWFPRDGKPQSFICGFPLEQLTFPRNPPLSVVIGSNRLQESACTGDIEVDGHHIRWDLHYRSSFATVISDVGWIGFCKTAHSDAVFSGQISLDAQKFTGEPLGFGMQGHNCGYRHRHLWTWAHAHLHANSGAATTFEALVYEVPLGLRVCKAVLWHDGKKFAFTKVRELLRDRGSMRWRLECSGREAELIAEFDGAGVSLHRAAYRTTNCVATFEVCNNSLARARFRLLRPGADVQEFSTDGGAVLEMVGG
jgi:hypothetical protein